MNLLPRSREEFAQTDYWNEFFKKRGNEAFEWYVCIQCKSAGSARFVFQAKVSIYYVNYVHSLCSSSSLYHYPHIHKTNHRLAMSDPGLGMKSLVK